MLIAVTKHAKAVAQEENKEGKQKRYGGQHRTAIAEIGKQETYKNSQLLIRPDFNPKKAIGSDAPRSIWTG